MTEVLEQLQALLDYRIERAELFQAALTHTSAGQGDRGVEMERLEFLGDAVLSLAVTSLLIRQRPRAPEGELTRVRARLVNTAALARKAREIGLAELVVLGKGEEKTGGRHKPTILAGILEAVLGAVYLDGGFTPAQSVVERFFAADATTVPLVEEDPKTCLQELTQRLFKQLPSYETLSVAGPDHARDFLIEVSVAGRTLGRGSGRSKRLAAQHAAQEALNVLRAETDPGAAGGMWGGSRSE